MNYTLPPLTQERFTKWFENGIPNTDEIIVYPGTQLPCMTKTSALKNNLRPEHVFITQSKTTEEFFHRVLGDDGSFALLPKRMYATVYPNIAFNSIPSNNRIAVKLNNRRTLQLPFIPDSFYEQKKKSGKRGVTRPKRQREQRETPKNKRKKTYRGWAPTREHTCMDKNEFLSRIKAVMLKIDEETLPVLPPLNGLDIDSEQNQQAFATICKFVHFYARSELGMAREVQPAGSVPESLLQNIQSQQ